MSELGDELLKEGLPADETELSARDLICSDQLKPSPFVPGLPRFLRRALDPLSTSSAALDMRRANGVGGLLGPSSSSMALSGMVSEPAVETLNRRENAEFWVGDVPEADMRRR